MLDEGSREKDILVMLFIIQISILLEIFDGDRLVPLFILSMGVFIFLVIKEVARRVSDLPQLRRR